MVTTRTAFIICEFLGDAEPLSSLRVLGEENFHDNGSACYRFGGRLRNHLYRK
jgi:hypothetical protein